MNIFEKILADAKQERERRQAERERIFKVRQRLEYIDKETAYQPTRGEDRAQKNPTRHHDASVFVVHVRRGHAAD